MLTQSIDQTENPTMNATTYPTLNPLTPLAFVEPGLARQIAVSGYIYAGCLSAMLWDFLANLSKDLNIVRSHGITPPILIYTLARLSTLSWFFYGSIINTSPLFDDCSKVIRGFMGTYVLSVSSTALLFGLRVRAVYNKDNKITLLFIILWMGVIGGAILVPLGTTGSNIGPTKYCFVMTLREYAAAAGGVTLLYDTVVLMVISWRIMCIPDFATGSEAGIRVGAQIISGKCLPKFSREIVKDGQKYYLIATAFNLVAIAAVSSHAPMPLKTFCSLSNMLMMNAMASHVFRKTILIRLEGQFEPPIPAIPLGMVQFTVKTGIHERDTQSAHETPAGLPVQPDVDRSNECHVEGETRVEYGSNRFKLQPNFFVY